jgi:hypothetical protein
VREKEMKVTKELAKVFTDACNRVDTWEGWQRSLDPQGSEVREKGTDREEQESEQSQLKRSA